MKDKYGKQVGLRNVLINKNGVEAMCVSIREDGAFLQPVFSTEKLTKKSKPGYGKRYKRLSGWEITKYVTLDKS